MVIPMEKDGAEPQQHHPETPRLSEVDFLKQEYETEKKKWDEEAKDIKRKLGDFKFEAERQTLKTKKIIEERDAAHERLEAVSQKQFAKSSSSHSKALEAAQREIEYLKKKSIDDQRRWKDQCASMHSRIERYEQENERLRFIATEEMTRATHLHTERNALNELADTLNRELRKQARDFREFVEEYENQRQILAKYKEKYEWATVQNMEDQQYISHLTNQIDKAVVKAEEMVKRVKELRKILPPSRVHSSRLEWFLAEAQDQYEQVKSFFQNEGLLK